MFGGRRAGAGDRGGTTNGTSHRMRPFTSRKIAVLALIGLVALGILAHYDGLSYRSAVPDGYRHLPPGVDVHAFSPSIRESWNAVSTHLGAEEGAKDDTKLTGASDEWALLRELASEVCIFGDGVGLLEESGISTDDGIVLGRFPDRVDDGESEVPAIVAVFSLRDRKRFLELFSPFLRDSQLILYGADDDEEPVAFMVRLPRGDDQARLCNDDGAYRISNEFVRVEQEEELRMFLDPFSDVEVEIDCQAIYGDGRKDACLCEVQSLEETVRSEGDDGCRIASTGRSSGKFTFMGSVSVQQLGAGELPDRLERMEAYVAVLEDETAIVATDHGLIESAVSAPMRNFAHYANDAGMRRVQALRNRHFSGGTEAFAGAWRLPVPFGTGTAAFSVHVDESFVGVEFVPVLDYFRITSLRRLLSPLETAPATMQWPKPSQFGLAMADPHAPDYLHLLSEYLAAGPDSPADQFGTLVRVLRELEDSQVLAASVHVVGAREGVPMVSLGLAVGGDERARAMIRDIQEALREERDLAVLEGARARTSGLGDDDGLTVKSIIKAARIDLVSEPPEVWDAFGIRDDRIVRVGAYPEGLFVPDTIETAKGMVSVDYLVPTVTANDFKFRFNALDLSEDEKSGLERGRNRLVASYDTERRVIWFGTNLDSLLLTLGSGDRSREVFAAGPSEGNRGYRKIVAEAHLGWLSTQIHNHPDEQIRELLDSELIALDRYETISFSVTPDETLGGLRASVRLGR